MRTRGQTLTVARLWLWAPPLLYMALIFYYSSDPNPLPAITTAVWDKGLHATEYAALAVLYYRALRGEGMRRWTSVVVALVTTSVYAATDEGHQYFVPGRQSDVSDWLADTIGGAIGLVITIALVSLRKVRSRGVSAENRL